MLMSTIDTKFNGHCMDTGILVFFFCKSYQFNMQLAKTKAFFNKNYAITHSFFTNKQYHGNVLKTAEPTVLFESPLLS